MRKTEKVTGDVNNDKTVNVMDATYIQRYLCGYIHEDFVVSKADFDNDGAVTIFDATGIQRKLAGIKQ